MRRGEAQEKTKTKVALKRRRWQQDIGREARGRCAGTACRMSWTARAGPCDSPPDPLFPSVPSSAVWRQLRLLSFFTVSGGQCLLRSASVHCGRGTSSYTRFDRCAIYGSRSHQNAVKGDSRHDRIAVCVCMSICLVMQVCMRPEGDSAWEIWYLRLLFTKWRLAREKWQ